MDYDRELIWLTSISNIGSIRVKRLLERFGSAKGVWNASPEELVNIKGINKELCHNIINSRNPEKIDHYIEKMKKLGIVTVDIGSSYYPPLLREIYNPPYLLYAKGNVSLLTNKCIAIVGSRNSTHYGKKVAFKLAGQLSKRGFTVVSGFARGIDSYAHKGAMAVAGTTIAVLGNGLDVIYPRENYSLMKEIMENGLMVSEYPPGTSPLRGNFPARNRLISGLSVGVVVVEASEHSGALITADFAVEQNREVFAVPGNINSPNSTGTNRLIKEGAKMVNSVEDILEELTGFTEQKALPSTRQSKNIGISDENGVLTLIGAQPVHIDDLVEDTGLEIGELNAHLSSLEVEGRIERLPGNYYVLKE
jgi:DNA processing protein